MDLSEKAAAWHVTIDEIRETPYSVLGFGVREGTRVVLKLSKHAGDESNSGEVLKAFGEDGAVGVYESETGAVLLERLDPGEELVNLVNRGEDEEATSILAQVIRKLAGHSPSAGCPTVVDWGRGFERYLRSDDLQIPTDLVREAGGLYQELALSQRNPMLLHGDLQHYNVLFDSHRGWVAIDPKGVVGELEYEVGPILRNPVELPDLFLDPAVINRRLKILSETLNLDRSRVLRWSFAQAVLSAIWNIEDGEPVFHPTLKLAHTLKSMIQRKI